MAAKPKQIDMFPRVEILPELDSYDHVICAFSGGKDSVAAVLTLIEAGVKPELWHHEIDGRGPVFMDWPVTRDYCQKFADALGLQIFFSWREGGFERELLKENDRLAQAVFETPTGIKTAGGKIGVISTRRKFPAMVADLRTRWCSSVLKIDVMASAIANQERFVGKRILIITGERAEESSSRANYETFEPHRSHAPGPIAKRHVDHWRPVHGWEEEQVWEIIERHRINPHPSYQLGWGRTSCLFCIFGNKNQWASGRKLAPAGFARIAGLEVEFGYTIKGAKTKGSEIKQTSVIEQADAGTPYEMDPEIMKLAMSETYYAPIIVDEWTLPKGAYGESAGPT